MAKAIMIQGTMSNAGKSLLCAGLCRVFKQDGYRVAPFKSQNMALNSFITDDGLEMGRAQVVQAEACGIAPDVRMNPILLKPVSNVGSQVIVNGEVRGNMSAKDYFAIKQSLIPEIMQAYKSLDEEFDIIVLEGAGSPAEINLGPDGMVNMGMAKLAGAPVLLVGDIDRGGVFAQLYGTIALLQPDEQAMIKATVINKFRGDRSLLESGLETLETLTGKPVAGVVPYINVDIDDEDSLADRLSRPMRQSVLDIAVIRLPHLSNFTDFSALEAAGAGVRYVERTGELGDPDLLILPGTKNTIYDLQWLRSNGLEAAVKQYAAQGKPVIGICGGYQMLGRSIVDLEGVEGGGRIDGIGLLPVSTEFVAEKHRTRTAATVLAVDGFFGAIVGAELDGYEIHMGRTTLESGATPLLQLENGTADGCVRDNVCGAYLHGFFDASACSNGLLAALCARKGIAFKMRKIDRTAYKALQYDVLADAVRGSLDMDMIYKILQAGV